MRHTFTGCCARPATGHAAAAPPKRVMKSRQAALNAVRLARDDNKRGHEGVHGEVAPKLLRIPADAHSCL